MVETFEILKKIFNENGFRLFMVGSTSRDYLLNREIEDFDFVTNAKPEETIEFLSCDTAFARFGVLRARINDNRVDIVTLREEKNYEDSRHPNKIHFVDDVNKDYPRRDLTINAIYIDENYNVMPISSLGVEDLKNGIIRFIGDPEKRILEDPLRILRAIRFAKQYNFIIDENTKKILRDNMSLVEKLNPAKAKEEKGKMFKATGGEDYEI